MHDNLIVEKIDTIKMKLATKLCGYRRSNNLTQQQMADKCNISQGKYSKIENGKFESVTIDFLIRVNYLAGTDLKLI